MSSVKVVELVKRAKSITQDKTSVRWPLVELQDWLNDAYREIILIRPDANTQTGEFTCTSGTRQVITTAFGNATRLIDVVRNLAVSSNRGAIRIIERRVLDDQRALWHSEAQSINIEHYMFDPRLPKEFLVYPPASAAAKIEVVYASVPNAHTLTEQDLADETNTETIRIDDSYANVILDYMLYRAYSKDSDYAANAQRAVGHYNAMRESLGVKTQSDTAAQPQRQ